MSWAMSYIEKLKEGKTTIRHDRFSLLTLLVLLSSVAFAQNAGQLKIDSVRIYFNQNLDNFLSEIDKGKFVDYYDRKAIPIFIKNFLDSIPGGFTMANPKEEYACCCTSSPKLPRRKLLLLSKSRDILIMSYLTGGICVSDHLLFVKFEGNEIIDIWNGFSFPDLKTRGEIIHYVRKHRKTPSALHPNFDL